MIINRLFIFFIHLLHWSCATPVGAHVRRDNIAKWEANKTIQLPVAGNALRLSIITSSLALDPEAYGSALENGLDIFNEAIKEGKTGDYDRKDTKWTLWMSDFSPYTVVSLYPLPWVGFFGPSLAVAILEAIKGLEGQPLKCKFKVTGMSELQVVAGGFAGDGIPIPGGGEVQGDTPGDVPEVIPIQVS